MAIAITMIFLDAGLKKSLFGSKSNFGLKQQYKRMLILRLESMEYNSLFDVNFLNKASLFVFLKLRRNIIPINSIYKTCIIGIWLLDIIGSYRGYRHSSGLPVRGQRTWSNSKSTLNSNTILRNFKRDLFKFNINLDESLKTPSKISNLSTIQNLEQKNWLWKCQWFSEWERAKNKRINSATNANKYFKRDISSLTKINPNIKDLKKQNSFSIGYDFGFTKKLFINQVNKRLKKKKK